MNIISSLKSKQERSNIFCIDALSHIQSKPNNVNPDGSNSWTFPSHLILPNISPFKLY